MRLTLRKGFKERVNARFARFDMQVGILQNDEHKEPLERSGKAQEFSKNLTTYAGGPARKTARSGSKTLNEVSASNRDRLGINYLTEPLKKRDATINKFARAFFQMASGKSGSMRKRCENLLQAIVRNPILRGEYGRQSRTTTKIKGFYRPMIDTAQLFKAIKASIKTRGKNV